MPRVVALIVALRQTTFAVTPAAFGLLLSASIPAGAQIGPGTSLSFLALAAVQGIAILCFLAGRRRT